MLGKKGWSLLLFCLSLMVLDIFSKAYTHQSIPPMSWSSPVFPYGGIAVFHDWHGIDFSINYVMNKGAAWGVFASLQQYLLYARLVIIGGLISYLIFGKMSFMQQVAFYLIATGAIGNVVDFFVYGHVVDMFHFAFWGYSYPVFNIADASIFCGICLLFVRGFQGKSKAASKAKAS